MGTNTKKRSRTAAARTEEAVATPPAVRPESGIRYRTISPPSSEQAEAWARGEGAPWDIKTTSEGIEDLFRWTDPEQADSIEPDFHRRPTERP